MKNLRSFWLLAMVYWLCVAPIATVEAAPPELTYRYKHHLFSLYPSRYPSWQKTEEVWTYEGKNIRPPASLRVDGDHLPPLPVGMLREQHLAWDASAIADTIRTKIANALDREAGAVSIRLDGEEIVFDGVGLTGRRVLLDQAAELTIAALENEVADIVLPVEEIQPALTIDPALQNQGISEVVAVGESDFTGSPAARRHNIALGLSQFDGHIVSQGETFSFNDVLGPVNGATGYLKELVILGEKTLPAYGGGLCQVSTTAYRGVWEEGFPIAARRNHSFAVLYYSPQGTDATIYPPHTDMQFVNNSPGSILVQTHVEGNKAYFVYYGTADEREVEVIGPYVWGQKSAPADRVEYTTELAPGEERKVGEAVAGLKSAWFRVVRAHPDAQESIDSTYSSYEARPLYTQIGVAALPQDEEDTTPEIIQEEPYDTLPAWYQRGRRAVRGPCGVTGRC